MTSRSQEIKDELMKDRDTVFENQFELAKELLYFDEDGVGHPEVELSKISNTQTVYLSIVGAWFAHEAGVRDASTISRKEVAQATGIGTEAVSARVSELKDQKLVKAPEEGGYEAVYSKIESGLKDIKQEVAEDE